MIGNAEMGIWEVWDLRGYLPLSVVHKIGELFHSSCCGVEMSGCAFQSLSRREGSTLEHPFYSVGELPDHVHTVKLLFFTIHVRMHSMML